MKPPQTFGTASRIVNCALSEALKVPFHLTAVSAVTCLPVTKIHVQRMDALREMQVAVKNLVPFRMGTRSQGWGGSSSGWAAAYAGLLLLLVAGEKLVCTMGMLSYACQTHAAESFSRCHNQPVLMISPPCAHAALTSQLSCHHHPATYTLLHAT